jgi:adenine phosphoribosyltransferase
MGMLFTLIILGVLMFINTDTANSLKNDIPVYDNFPSDGIKFYDLMPLFSSGKYIGIVDSMSDELVNQEIWKFYQHAYVEQPIFLRDKIPIDKVVCVESRGIMLGAAVAQRVRCGFVPLRKPNKLPGDVLEIPYGLEYGVSKLCVQKSSISKNDSVVLIDDVLATGGTLLAATQLIKELGGKIESIRVLLEIKNLHGREKLSQFKVESLIQV